MSGIRMFDAPRMAAWVSMSLALAGADAVWADTITLSPVKDNTLIESPIGESSNGAADSIYAGRTGALANFIVLRGVLAFDVASVVPAGSTINSASLTLTLLQTVSGNQPNALHRLNANWGEGTSSFPGGSGGPATPGDATWIHTFFDSTFWTTPGGDFVAASSATQMVGGLTGPYTWASSQVTADVQDWIDNPASNFGWILIGNEAGLMSAKRFGSRENVDALLRPRLVIDFTPPLECPADISPKGGDGQVNVNDLLLVIGNWGATGPNAADIDGNRIVDVNDLLAVIGAWGPCS